MTVTFWPGRIVELFIGEVMEEEEEGAVFTGERGDLSFKHADFEAARSQREMSVGRCFCRFDHQTEILKKIHKQTEQDLMKSWCGSIQRVVDHRRVVECGKKNHG